MKVRVKFAKEGAMKFIGHLDTMRYFQKAVRRAKIDVAFSEGFSPHMIMSFAAPLGVGVTSSGEYFDMELSTPLPSKELERRLNDTMAEGMKVVSVRKVGETKADNAMALVAAADYTVRFRKGCEPCENWQEKICTFAGQDSITIVKKTKRSEAEVDIRPWIYSLGVEGDCIRMQLSSGSVKNLKPELVLEAFAAYAGVELKPFALLIHRDEIYADRTSETERKLVPLEALGEEIE